MQNSRHILKSGILLPESDDNAINLDVIDVHEHFVGQDEPGAEEERDHLQRTAPTFRPVVTTIHRTADLEKFLRDSRKPKTRIMYVLSPSFSVGGFFFFLQN
jgi:hypothetical protein